MNIKKITKQTTILIITGIVIMISGLAVVNYFENIKFDPVKEIKLHQNLDQKCVPADLIKVCKTHSHDNLNQNLNTLKKTNCSSLTFHQALPKPASTIKSTSHLI